jgi:acetylornithine aminotransferase
MNYFEKWERSILASYSTPSIVLVKGSGVKVIDEHGKQYLDFLAGIAVNSLGHAHPAIVKAVTKQVETLGHVSNLAINKPSVDLAMKLLDLLQMPGGRIFFCNSGAEANEAAFKLARAYKPESEMVSVEGGFHGRTMGALSVTGQPEKQEPFKPLLSNVRFAKMNDAKSIDSAINPKTGGIWLESIQGEAGVIPATAEFISASFHAAERNNALIVMDEVQTGIARTGNWFGFEKFGVKPHLVPLAKGLGGGIPIGALAVQGSLVEAIKPGGHGTTFGGNPIGAAAGLAVIETIEQLDLMKHVQLAEVKIRELLESEHGVVEVRGSGLLLGVVLSGNYAKLVEENARQNGLIVNAVRPNVIRLAPPLIVTMDEIKEGMDVLRNAITKSMEVVS